jgi:hypothetical protein
MVVIIERTSIQFNMNCPKCGRLTASEPIPALKGRNRDRIISEKVDYFTDLWNPDSVQFID